MEKIQILSSFNMKQLREFCKEKNVIGISKLKKTDLIDIMVELQEFDYLFETKKLETIYEEGASLPEASWDCACDEVCGECADDYPDPAHYEDKLEVSVVEEEEEVILHLPIDRLNLESVIIKKDFQLLKPKNYDKMYAKGKLILEKFKC